jgi:hypothetical protein
MPEIAMFVRRGAAQITPKILKGIHKLPMLKMEFAQIYAPVSAPGRTTRVLLQWKTSPTCIRQSYVSRRGPSPSPTRTARWI